MNSRVMIKKPVKRPLQLSLTQNTQSSNPRTNFLHCKMVSAEEYNKLLFQNQKLARDNANIKSQLSQYKEAFRSSTTEIVELKQQLSVANNEAKRLELKLKNKKSVDMNQIAERVKHTIGLFTDEYLAIDGLKHQINEFGSKLETIKGVMSSLLSSVENTQMSQELDSDVNQINDTFYGFNNSVRLSMTSQERDYSRRRSSDMIRRDFQVLTELSTILEMSCENRMSSLGSIHEVNAAENCSAIDATATRPMEPIVTANSSMSANNPSSNLEMLSTTTTCCATTSVATTSASEVIKNMSEAGKGKKGCAKTKVKKVAKVKNDKKESEPSKKNTKTKTTANKRKPLGQKSTKADETTSEDNVNVYDFREEDKENAMLSYPIQRHSRQTRSKKQSLFP